MLPHHGGSLVLMGDGIGGGMVALLIVALIGAGISHAWTAKDAYREMAVCEFEWAKQEPILKSEQLLGHWGYAPPEDKAWKAQFDRDYEEMKGQREAFTRLCMVAAGFKQTVQGELCKDTARTVYWPVCWYQKRWWN